MSRSRSDQRGKRIAGEIGGRGAFAVTGNAAAIRISRRLSADVGGITLTARAAAIRVSRRLAAEPGVFVVTTSPAIMIIGKASAPIVIPAARRVAITASGSRTAALSTAGSRRLKI